MNDLHTGDRVRQKIRNLMGTITMSPRAHSAAAQVRLDGNASATYQRLVDLEFVERPGKPDVKIVITPPAEFKPSPPNADLTSVPIRDLAATVPLPPGGLKPESVADVKAINDLDLGMSDDAAYGGDLKLGRLVAMRNDLYNKCAMIDDQILALRIAVMVDKALSPLKRLHTPDMRAKIAAEAVRAGREAAGILKEFVS